MEEVASAAATGFSQALYLLGGMALCLLGGAILLYVLDAFIRALRVPAVVAALRHDGRLFYPVYRYTMPSGKAYETVSDTGSNFLSGKATGHAVTLYVFPDDPEGIRSNLRGIMFLGMVFFAPGALLLYTGIFSYPFTPMSWIVLGVLALAGLRRLYGIWIPAKERQSKAAFRAALRRRRSEKFSRMRLTTLEEYLQSPEGRRRMAENEQGRRVGIPLFLLLSLVSLFGAWHTGGHLRELMIHGVRAEGVIESFETQQRDGQAIYRPRVAFSDTRSERQVFVDRRGASHPAYAQGDRVTVIYAPDRPEETALIDEGWVKNGFWPGMLLLLGLLAGAASAYMISQQRQYGGK